MDNTKALADLIVGYINERRNDKEGRFYKDAPKNKKGIEIGGINSRLSKIVSRLIDDQAAVDAINKAKQPKEQAPLSFQQDRFQKLLNLLPEETIDDELSVLQAEHHQFSLSLEQEFDPITWLTNWTPKAKDISFATHVAKLTHSSSKSSSILDATTETSPRYLTTNSLTGAYIDTAAANAASLPIADVLNLSIDGISLLDCMKSGDDKVFSHLTDNKALIAEWCEGLKQAYDSTQKQSYFLNKQVYFPIKQPSNTPNDYDLLLPLVSSSLVHSLHLEHQKYYSEETTAAREQRRKEKYHPTETKSYPSKAYLHVTRSNHSNASSLNGKRGGRMALFCAAPPQWQSHVISVVNKSTIFDKQLSYQLRNETSELRDYLRLLHNKSLSTSEPDRNRVINKKLTYLSDAFFFYVQVINQNETTPNWTQDSDLPIEQQLLFEPLRDDNEAQTNLLDKQWLKDLSASYGLWLSRQIQTKQLPITNIQSAQWTQHFLLALKEYIAVQEVAL